MYRIIQHRLSLICNQTVGRFLSLVPTPMGGGQRLGLVPFILLSGPHRSVLSTCVFARIFGTT